VMVVESGRVALARQQYLKADASLETHKEELMQLKVRSLSRLSFG
jgi:hypothetical protein